MVETSTKTFPVQYTDDRPLFEHAADDTFARQPCLHTPLVPRFLTLFAGWVRTSGLHAVTESLVVAGVSGTLHHAAFHRFFSRARWSLDEVGRLLLLKLVALAPGPLRLVLDDTLCTHKGPKVFGLGVHVDAVRSTRKRRLLTFGHVWVVLAVLVPVPFSGRVWALPILFRLFRTEADCQKREEQHLKKTQLARQLIEQVKRWLPDKCVELVADTACSCREVLRHLPPGVVFVGAMRGDSTLQRPRSRKYRSPATGRLLTKDILLPKPAKLARDEKVPWLSMTLTFIGSGGNRSRRLHALVSGASPHGVGTGSTQPSTMRTVVPSNRVSWKKASSSLKVRLISWSRPMATFSPRGSDSV